MTVRSFAFLLDAEPLSAAAQAKRGMLPWLEVVRQSDSVLYVSALTLTEVTDGGARDANVRRAANAMRIVPVTDAIGYAAGRLRRPAARVRHKARDLTVDAVIAATGLALPAPVIVLTGDPDDLRLLLQGTNVRVEEAGA